MLSLSSPSSLSAAMSAEFDRSRRSAWRKYAALLAELLAASRASLPPLPATRAAPLIPEPCDAKQLSSLRAAAAALGRTPEDVESDASALSHLLAARAQ